MKKQQPRRWLLELTFIAVKYFLLALAGCTLAYIMAFTLEYWLITEVIMIAVEHLLIRILVLIGCLAAAAVITESVRY
ncbi:MULTISPECIES: hypothetical protein [Cyanophyceae]|uniref:hypothetical protein n=1 Tax=Cyanophyceae TaxID=3028117 RepID=UPI00168781FB|nr:MULTISPECIES: hypothetical protein [Cyanophyceae]MBD1917855.1 hypothetical protein [Phormidium sp. FACHB-77]MBD2032973.1 hypothetical protein [Phormidium sp. FACHB-322]MBD2051721.1 hypothetical protein [Leptolyngbya sp. FACHB-60]